MEWAMIAAAGFLGGALNAVAGGGSFITLPALIFAGVAPVSANATGTAALLPGYIASAWRFRKDMTSPAGLGWWGMTLTAMAGGCLGGFILLLTSEQLFSALIPWLILVATAMFVIGPRFLKNERLPSQSNGFKSQNKMNSISSSKGSYRTICAQIFITKGHVSFLKKTLALLVLFSVCAYGGYFNGGLGIILLATLGLMGQRDLIGMNGVKNFISAVLTTIAVLVYAAGNVISGRHLLVLGGAAVLGGYAGAVVAYRVSQKLLRAFVVVVGGIMAFMFFLR